MILNEFNQFMSLVSQHTYRMKTKLLTVACEVQETGTMSLFPNLVHANHNSLFLGSLYWATLPLVGPALAGPASQNAILRTLCKNSSHSSGYKIQPKWLFLQEALLQCHHGDCVPSPKLSAIMSLSCTDATRLFLEYIRLLGQDCQTCPLAQMLKVVSLSRSKPHLQHPDYT